MNDPISRFLSRSDPLLHEGRLGLLCNQTSYSPTTGEYLFQTLDERGVLRRVFAPEHGLFAELQDQVGLTETDVYHGLGLSAEIVSLYGDTEDSLAATRTLLSELDALVVDVQDVGSRYYTFATTLSYVFDTLAAIGSDLTVFVIDRLNPAGRQVEGTPLPEDYASFVGRPGLPHRHGLTIGELAHFYRDATGSRVHLEVQDIVGGDVTWVVSPSPNMPTVTTSRVYSGQCLLEGTNLSEGRGTTRPFEFFGAPFLDWIWSEEPPRAAGATLRKTRFLPTFHKHAGTVCHGFQIHLTGEPYHSLRHSLELIRWIRERSPDGFGWHAGAYEFRSDRPAIELLAGDEVLLEFLRRETKVETLRAHLREGELAWCDQAAQWLRYEEPLFRAEMR